jgi:hypothetical protein
MSLLPLRGLSESDMYVCISIDRNNGPDSDRLSHYLYGSRLRQKNAASPLMTPCTKKLFIYFLFR